MAIKVGDAILFVSADTTGLEKSVAGVNKKINKIDVDKIGKKFALLGVAVAGSAIGIIKMASDFESAFAGVRKTVDLTEDGFDDLNKRLRAMSREIPVTSRNLAGIAEIAGQMGVKGVKNIEKFTRTIADLGVSTDLTFEQGSKELARFINITQGSVIDIDRVGAAIVDLGNNFATSESEISAMSLRLGSAGTIAGLTQAEILGVAAAASALGLEAEAGGTAISRLLRLMADRENAFQFSQVIGVSAKEFKSMNENDPSGTLLKFVQSLGEVNSKGGDVNEVLKGLGIEQVRMIDTIGRLALGSEQLAEALDVSTDAYEENTALTEEAEKRYKTFASQVSILWNSITDLAVLVGTPFLEPLAEFIDKDIIPALSDFGAFITEHQDIIQEWIEDGIDFARKGLEKYIPKLKSAAKKTKEFAEAHPKATENIVLWGFGITGAAIAVGTLGVAVGGVTTLMKLLGVQFAATMAVKVGGWVLGLIGAGSIGGVTLGSLTTGSLSGFLGLAAAVLIAWEAGSLLGRWLDDITQNSAIGAWIDRMSNSLVQLADAITGVAKLRDVVAFGDTTLGDLLPGVGGQFGPSQGGVDFNARGGFPSGASMVGERGPEIIRPPSGSRVFSNQESRAIGGGGGNMQVTINVNGAGGNAMSIARAVKNELLQTIKDGEFGFGAQAVGA